MKRNRLRNKLLLINICIFGLVFFCQFIFQNFFFKFYYQKYQGDILNKKINQLEIGINKDNINDELVNELTKDNILVAYLDNKLMPKSGNLFNEDSITIKTDNNEIMTVYLMIGNIDSIFEIGSQVKATLFRINGDDKYYISSLMVEQKEESDSIAVSNQIVSEDFIDIPIHNKTDITSIQGEIIKYTKNNHISFDHQTIISNYLFNNKELTDGLKKINDNKNDYLLQIKKINDGYLIASISLEQYQEIILILNDFNRYIILFTIILVTLIIFNYSRSIINPILKMKKCAQAIAVQDFDNKVHLHSKDELQELGEALNDISRNLENKIVSLENMNNKLKTEYEERLEIEQHQKNLLMNISHDLKTPLTVIKGYLKAIKDGMYSKEQYIDYTIDSVDQISNSLNEMLELTKFQSKSYKLSLEKIDLTRLIYKTLNNIIYLSKQKNQDIELDLLDDVFITVDEEAMRKVIQNLLSNAIKYSPECNKIFIRLIKQEKHYLLSIENTGVHIPENDLKHVFDEFYRVDKARNKNVKGNGLGLGIVKIILDRHGLKYSIENTSKGVIFIIDFKEECS